MRDQILTRIKRLGEGKVFSAKDFLDIASRGTIDMALAGLTRLGTIRRIGRGLYDIPTVSDALGGILSPDIDEAARAIARRQHWKIMPEGAWAANLLGLSLQVPSKIVYLSDGPNKDIQISRRSIHFKHARPKAMAGLEGKIALVVQALWTSVLCLSGTYGQLLDYVVFGDWIFFGLVVATIFAYRRRDAQTGVTPTVYRVPGYPVLPALFVIIAAYVVVSAIWSNPRNAALGAALIAAGVPAFLFWQSQNRIQRGGDVAVAR